MKKKVSATVDEHRLAEAKRLTGCTNVSAVLDEALEALIVSRLEPAHIEGYARLPQGGETVSCTRPVNVGVHAVGRRRVTLRRGEIWFADVLGDKRRPVVVRTHDSVLPRLTTIFVAPVTTRIRHIPTEVPESGLPKACVGNLDNITPLPKATLVERAGRLSADELTALCTAARFAIGC